MTWRAFFVALAVASAGCATVQSPNDAARNAALEATHAGHLAKVEAAAARARDLMMRARGPAMTLLAADLAFNDDAKARGLQTAFSKRFLEDGKLIGAGAPIAVGPAAVAAAYAESGDMTLTWAPMEATVDGDLGVTWGIAALRFTDPRGQLQVRSTRYVTVCKKVDDDWRIWIAAGGSGPLPDVSPP